MDFHYLKIENIFFFKINSREFSKENIQKTFKRKNFAFFLGGNCGLFGSEKRRKINKKVSKLFFLKFLGNL